MYIAADHGRSKLLQMLLCGRIVDVRALSDARDTNSAQIQVPAQATLCQTFTKYGNQAFYVVNQAFYVVSDTSIES